MREKVVYLDTLKKSGLDLLVKNKIEVECSVAMENGFNSLMSLGELGD